MSKLFEDAPKLQAEHQALHDMACIIAEKWKGMLESSDCNYSYQGIKFLLEMFEAEIASLDVLIERHEEHIKAYREEKRLKKESEE